MPDTKKRPPKKPWWERIPEGERWGQIKLRLPTAYLRTIVGMRGELQQKRKRTPALAAILRYLVRLGLEQAVKGAALPGHDAIGRLDPESERWRYRPSHPCYYAVYTAEGWFCGREVPGAALQPGLEAAQMEIARGHVLVDVEGRKVTGFREREG